MMQRAVILCASVCSTGVALASHASVAEYISGVAWKSAVNHQFNRIAFTDIRNNIIVSDQYNHLGVTFYALNLVTGPVTYFPNDAWGVRGLPSLSMKFGGLKHWVAVDHAGPARFELYRQGQLIHVSQISIFSGVGNFAGMLSTEPFDEVQIRTLSPFVDHVYIDDVYWGPRDCPADLAPEDLPNGTVNVDDLLAVINAWGPCGNPTNCPADIAPAGPPVGNDVVNVDDLLAVINGWGACP